MLARVRQFLEAGREPTAADLALAREHLRDSLLDLFLAQEPRDIHHGARTARWLVAQGHTNPDLVQAALLHDIGKGRQRRRDRVAYVVAGWLHTDRWLASAHSGLEIRRAVARSRAHAATGADMLRQAGAPERVVELTERHHVAETQDGMLRLLIAADAAS